MEPLGTRAIRDIDLVALRENDETKDELEVEEAYVEEDMGTVDIDISNNSAQATSSVEENILEKGIKSSDQTNSTTKSSSNEKATSTSVEKNTSSGNSQGNGSAHTRNSRENNPATKEKDSNEGEDAINMKEGEGSKHDYEDENDTAGDISDDDPVENKDEEKKVKEEMDEDKDLENQSN